MYFDKHGNHVEPKEFARLLRDRDYGLIHHDIIEPFEILTRWLGVAYAQRSKEFVIYNYFETNIFCGDEFISTEFSINLDEAERTHNFFIEKYSKIVKQKI